MNPGETSNRIAVVTNDARRLSIWILLLFLLFTAGGCSFSRLEKDLENQNNMVIIGGEVSSETATAAPIIIYLLTNDPLQPRVVNYKVLKKPGRFTFLAVPGTYRVFAYVDHNHDRRHQDNERTGSSGLIPATQPGTRINNLSIMLPKQVNRNLVHELDRIKNKVKIDLVNYKLHTGEITTLAAPYFAKEFVSMGLWEPLKFVEEVPFGIFFMEEYSPAKIPVLFVHGVSGSPRCFSRIIENLDREHFQPWLVYYPSGVKIETVAEYIFHQLNELDVRYDYNKLEIIAHSMGGLVCRCLVNQISRGENDFQVERMITISTPFAGHKAAALGLKYAPAVIPVWNDVAPGSDFLNQLFQKPLPENLSHYLLFSFEGSSRFTGDNNNDGVVTIASELRPEAQEEAVLIRGFPENHTSILKSQSVITLINQILNHKLKNGRRW